MSILLDAGHTGSTSKSYDDDDDDASYDSILALVLSEDCLSRIIRNPKFGLSENKSTHDLFFGKIMERASTVTDEENVFLAAPIVNYMQSLKLVAPNFFKSLGVTKHLSWIKTQRRLSADRASTSTAMAFGRGRDREQFVSGAGDQLQARPGTGGAAGADGSAGSGRGGGHSLRLELASGAGAGRG